METRYSPFILCVENSTCSSHFALRDPSLYCRASCVLWISLLPLQKNKNKLKNLFFNVFVLDNSTLSPVIDNFSEIQATLFLSGTVLVCVPKPSREILVVSNFLLNLLLSLSLFFCSITLCLCATQARMSDKRVTSSLLSNWSTGYPAVCRCSIRYSHTHTHTHSHMPFNKLHAFLLVGSSEKLPSPWPRPLSDMAADRSSISAILSSLQHLFRSWISTLKRRWF